MKKSSNCKEGSSSSSSSSSFSSSFSSSSSSCISSCCSSSVLMLVVVPLILVSAGFVCAISGPNTWDSLCYHPWLCSSSSSSSSNKREGDTSPSSFSPSDPLPSSIATKIDSNSTRSSSIGNKESDHANDDQRHVDHVQQEEEEAEILSDALKNSSSSSSPPQVAETIQIQVPQHDGKTKEEGSKAYMNTSEAVVVVVVPETTRVIQRQHTKLQKLEAGLARARAAIREEASQNQIRNQTISDPDYVPMGPMYWNSHVFHRSYLEMEKQFKIFIYEEGEPPLFHSGPCKSIYSMEGNFIHSMEMENHYRTRDPNKAHAYFLPFSVAMMVRYVYIPNSHDITPIKKTVIDYVNVIGSKYPYWNRSFGADHFMLSCHDWGPVTSSYIPYLFKNSIRALCNANTSEGFTPSKDVSFPEINLRTGDTNGWIGGPSPSQRPILAFFAGGLHGPIRPVLLEHWENKDNDIRVYKYLPKGISYHNMMQTSKYCICPSGYEVASPRIVEAIYTGCVPVLISDNYVPPFSDVLNWKTFSVEVPVSEIPNLKTILMGISSRQYIRMQRRGVQVRKHFEVNSPPKRFDVFHMILHSIWLRRLNVQINDQ